MLSPAPVSPPYFETGVPHRKDQFISATATAWAANALMLALPADSTQQPLNFASLAQVEQHSWIDTALFGNATQLKELLDNGLNPNSKTAAGTTILMMAAHDPAKVKLLLGRGADAKAKTKTGFTALMVACSYRDTEESVKLLLANGAEAAPGKGVAFNASPLFFAAFAGDLKNVDLLKARGADINRPMLLLGQSPVTPLMMATLENDTAMMKRLIALGSDPNQVEEQTKMTVLHWAALGNRTAAVNVLLQAGAKVNAVDSFGYTPLLYASTVDFGNDSVVRSLLAAGADRSMKTPEGRTAADQASKYRYPHISKALAGSN
ncbi:MAG: ankyrin repeat domain-containing protein [Acidobacteriia bacterium]|nr:ankyrin repeat domain-containing protein [Terriglobia bacterium]